jgi:hypothetical protein
MRFLPDITVAAAQVVFPARRYLLKLGLIPYKENTITEEPVVGSEQKQPMEFEPGFAFAGPRIAAAAGLRLAVMKHEIRVSLLPRCVYLALLWALGLGVAGSVAITVVSLAEERKLDEAIAQLAHNARALLLRARMPSMPTPEPPVVIVPPVLAIPAAPAIARPRTPPKRRAATKAPVPKAIPSRAERMREALQRYRQLRAANAEAPS